MNREHREPEALVNMRTHLTVLALAVGQLRRRHGETEDIERLCASADTAIHQLTADIADLEMMLGQSEMQKQSGQAHIELRQSVTADARHQETGPLGLPPHVRHGQTS